MIRTIIIALMLVSCGSGGGSSSGGSNTKKAIVEYTPPWGDEISCLANERNCSNADVDLDAPVIWAADNGIKIVHIRWAGCSSEGASKYAFDRGVTIICISPLVYDEVTNNSPYTILVSSSNDRHWYGRGVDVSLLNRGSIHSGILATALIATGRELKDIYTPYPETPWHSDKAIMIVDNGFDSVRPLYVLYKNTALAGEVTGDYGVKAINELQRWIDIPVIGYVPFNALPEEPRIDGWEIL